MYHIAFPDKSYRKGENNKMKKATNRILSFLTAFAMVIGVLVAPFTSANAASTETGDTTPTKTEETKTLTIHKILMSEQGLKDHDAKKEYDGKEIQDIAGFFETNAKEIAGVYFKLQKPAQGVTDPDVNNNDHWEDLGEGYQGLTTENGFKIEDVSTLKGKYRIVEVYEESTYVGEKGATLTDRKAVPSIIVLPLVNNDGVVENAHMYPKNTENAPKIDKNFIKENGLEAVEDNQKNKDAGAAYENYQKEKATAEAELGKNVPYEVKTEIPANSNLAEAKWDDKMTEGLTYNKDLEVTIEYTEVTGEGENTKEEIKTSTLTKDVLEKSGELTQTDNGFVLKLQDDNLALLNGKVKPVTVTLKYSATVNNKAIVDIPEANDVKFFYGNTPSQGTTPLPTKPNDNGELKVIKNWDDGEWAEEESATFQLIDANTGEPVTKDKLVDAPEDYNFEGTVTIGYDAENGGSYTWKYLNKDKQYKAVEIDSTTMSDAEYTIDEDGNIAVTNHKSTNPKPLNPTEPKVVLGGRKFIKTNNENKDSDKLERLAGAVFYVKNADGEYLVADQKDAQAVADAKETLDKAVETYNNLEAKAQTDEEKAKVTKAQKDYNDAFKKNATAYKWEADAKNAVELTSDGQGRFEIAGLEYGTYYLEEKEQPKGYAKLQEDEKFEVKKGSYQSTEADLQYNKEDTKNGYGLQIKNKKVTIPETGGIGSLIFIVAGLALMGIAFVAMKRRNTVEA